VAVSTDDAEHRRGETPMTPSPARWQPSRAGILNVYQYEDETLH